MKAIPLIERIQADLREVFPEIEVDGDIGKRTKAALRQLAEDSGGGELRRHIQGILSGLFEQVRPDGVFGPITYSAIDLLDEMGDHESLAEMVEAGRLPEKPHGDFHIVTASSFADPQDVAAYRRCKAQGGSDQKCFAIGDNGIGAWGADTTVDRPMIALPREVWRHAGKRGGAPVEIRLGEFLFAAELGDTMPSLANIKNGAGMDCNPACVRKLGKKPPMMLAGVGWRWA